MSRVTLRDLAGYTGLSLSTVSLALRDSPRIAPKTRQRVQEIAEEMGYRGLAINNGTHKVRPKHVGLICRIEQELHVDYYRKISKFIQENDDSLLLEDETTAGGFAQAMRNLVGLKVDALIAIDPKVTNRTTTLPVPTLVIGQDSILPNVDLVTSNNWSGMRQVSGLVQQQGARRVTYLDGPAGISAKARRDAFVQTAFEHGISAEVVSAGDSVDAGFEATQTLLKTAPKPEVLVCYNDHCAQGALMALLRAGLSVPEDVSVIGYDNTSVGQTKTFAITSVDRDSTRIAKLAVETTSDRMNGNREAARKHIVETQLIRRQTTRGVAPAH